jgi:hypothetical protein
MYDFDEIRKRFPSAQGLSENQIVERLAQKSGVPYEQVAAQFGITKDTSSGLFGGAQDVVIEAANAAAGLVGSASEFVSPGNRLSRGIRENIIEPGEARQTVPTQLAKRNLSRGLETSEFGPQARAVYEYVTENPLLALGQAAGGFAPVGLPIRGAQAAATGLGLGAAGARRAGLTTGSAISGAAAGGEAGGSAYELVMNTPREVLLAHPQARALIESGVTDEAAIYEELATRAARRASVVPAAIGAVAGAVGAESALVSPVRGLRGVAGKTLTEFGTEGLEEGATTYSGRAAAQEYNPAIDPMAGVAGSALLGGVMGAGVAAPIALARMERDPAAEKDLTQPDTAPAAGAPVTQAPEGEEAPVSPILTAARTLADFDPYAEIEARAAAGRPMSEAEATQFLSSTLAAQRAGQQFMDLMQRQQESAGRAGEVGEQYQRMIGQRGDQILRAQDAGEAARPIVAGLEQDLTAQEAPFIAAQQAGAGTQQLPGMVAGAGTVADYRRIMNHDVMQPVETQEFQPVERTALLPQQPAPFSNIRMDRPGPAPTPAPSSLLSERPAEVEPVTPVGAPTAVAAALPAAQTAAGVSSTATTGAPSGTQAPQAVKAKTQRQKVPVAAGSVVKVNDTEVTLDKEQADAWNAAQEAHDGKVRRANAITNYQERDSALRAAGMQLSAERRKITGALTSKEKEAAGPKNVSEAIKEDNEIDRVLKAVEAEDDAGADKLFAGVTGQAKKAPGRPSMPTQVYAAIRNAILNPKGAVMVRKAKSVEKDVALTEKYGDKVKRIAAAAKAFADAYETYSSQNLVRSDETIKRDTTADAAMANRAEVLQANARAVQSTLAKLGEAVDGNAKDVEAIVRFVKDRAQKEKRSDEKVVQNDILLSRAWAAAKRETFIGEPDLLDVSPTEVRQSRESTARGATPQLVEAATEGYKIMGKGEAQTGLNGILNYIRTVGTPFEKTLAQAIKLAVKGKAPIKIKFVKEGLSKYDPKTNTITINETSSKEVALHEALHGALQWFVYTNPNAVQVVALKTALQRVVNFDTAKLTPKAAEVQAILSSLMKESKAFAQQAKNAKTEAKKEEFEAKAAAKELDAVLELVSYGNTLNDFRRALQGMESNAPRTFTKFANDVMDAIYALVRRMLGSSQTVASDVMENTFQLLEAARAATQETAPKKGNVLQAAVDTATSAFKRWFGDSKVVDRSGNPLVVYHGTDKDFDTFKSDGEPIFLAPGAWRANLYADKDGARIMPLYARVTNPATMKQYEAARNANRGPNARVKAVEVLRAQGYDGVIDDITVIVFDPTQIKSATGNKGTYDPASGNILEAAIQSGNTPVVPGTALPRTQADAITEQFQNPVTEEQLKKLSKTLLPEQVSFKFLFDTLGWASVPGKLEGASKKISDYVQKNHPGAATVASWVNSHFGLQSGVKDALVRAKDDRRGGSMIYNQIAQYFTDLPPQQSVAVLEYMDAKLANLRKQGAAPTFPINDPQMKDLADATITKWWEYARALRDPKQRNAYAGLEQSDGRWTGGVEFSQGLAFAESVDQLASPSFGVRNISKLISTRTKDEVTEDAITFRTDANGSAELEDKFVGMFLLTPSLKKRLDNAGSTAAASQILAELKPDEFISADLLTQDGKPRTNKEGVQLIPDRNYLWDLAKKDKGGFRFTARLDAKQALLTKKGRDLGHALQNTMAILANSYSANRLTEALLQYEAGTPNATAFNSLDDLNAMLNGEYKGDKYELNKNEASWTKRVKQNQIIKLTDDEAKSETVKGLYRNRNQWVQLPNSPTYGALAGKIVNGSVWSAIEDMSDRRPLVNSAVYNGTMRWFKKAKTVYNPATWGTNVASNFTMAMMDDIPLPTLGYATKLYVGYMLPPAMASKLGISLTREQQQLMLEIMKTNALLGDFSSSELKQSIYDSMRSTIGDKEQGVAERIMQFAKMEKDRIEAIKKYAGKGSDAAERTDQLLGDWYAMQDNVFRVASMLNNLGQQAQAGKTIDAEAYRLAGDHARFAFLDYDIDSKAVRIMRQTAFPFISWPYAAAKMIGNVAVHKPWKLVNLYAGLWMLDALTQAMTGDDDDELRESGPEWARSRMLFGLGPHTHIRVPFMGDSENPVYYDIGKYITPSSFGDKVPNAFLGLSWWPSFVSPGGPFISSALAIVGGIDPYSGRPLSPPSDSDWEKLSDRLAYTQSLFAPNLPFLNARELEKAKTAFEATEGRSENYSSLYLARTAGMRFYDFNVQGSLDQQDRAAAAVEREYKTEIGKLKRKQERLENPDWDAFYEREEELMMRMEKRIAEIRGKETGEE